MEQVLEKQMVATSVRLGRLWQKAAFVMSQGTPDLHLATAHPRACGWLRVPAKVGSRLRLYTKIVHSSVG